MQLSFEALVVAKVAVAVLIATPLFLVAWWFGRRFFPRHFESEDITTGQALNALLVVVIAAGLNFLVTVQLAPRHAVYADDGTVLLDTRDSYYLTLRGLQPDGETLYYGFRVFTATFGGHHVRLSVGGEGDAEDFFAFREFVRSHSPDDDASLEDATEQLLLRVLQVEDVDWRALKEAMHAKHLFVYRDMQTY